MKKRRRWRWNARFIGQERGVSMAGVVEKHEVTVEQVLQDARFHMEQGAIAGSELEMPLGVKDSGVWTTPSEASGKDILSIRRSVQKAMDKVGFVHVCSLGGIIVSRILLNGELPKQLRDYQGFNVPVTHDPITQKAIVLLATAIDADEVDRRRAGAHRVAKERSSWGPISDEAKRQTFFDNYISNCESIITRWNDGHKGLDYRDADDPHHQDRHKQDLDDILKTFDVAIDLARQLKL